MANIKSAIKRNRQNEKRREHNRLYRGAARTAVRKAKQALETDDVEASREAILVAVSALDRAAAKGIVHKNNAARRKSRLMQRLAELESEAK